MWRYNTWARRVRCGAPELNRFHRSGRLNQRIEECLADHDGNRTHAADELGISLRTLQRKLKDWKAGGRPKSAHPYPR